ncbi:MAG: hypothetical protein CTY37_06580 [Methylotenera sp.]|nr:MAG: hypothetical protein CTY37_06580 [Methylotenera sp.]
MKICYLILIHHKFEQAKRLINQLANSQTCFVIHIDAKVDQATYERFKQDMVTISSIHYSKRIDVKWGAFSLTKAIMETILHAVSSDVIKCDRYMLISGQDYPIVSNQAISNFIETHQTEEFIEAVLLDLTDDKTKVWTPFYRFIRYHFWVGKKRISTALIKKNPPNIPIYHGSAWWLLTSKSIEYLADVYIHNKKINRFFSTSFMSDEAYIQTLLMSSPFSTNIVGRSLTYTNWENASGAHPKTLTKDDIAKINTSNCLFARKLDTDLDIEIFNLLDLQKINQFN